MTKRVGMIDTADWSRKRLHVAEGAEIILHFESFAVILNDDGAALILQRREVDSLIAAGPRADRVCYVWQSNPEPTDEDKAKAERLTARSLQLFPKGEAIHHGPAHPDDPPQKEKE